MGGAVTLFRIAGIPVRFHASWLIIYGLIAWSLSVGYFPRVLPDVPVLTHWASGLVAALLLFVSVFLHELSHSIVARAHDLPVSAITLHVFGGVSELGREPESPGVEFRVAIVGPLSSFALAGLAFAGAALVGARPMVAAILGYLAAVNLLVGAFNLVPGFPLDGGRVLRAILWRAKGNLQWATRVASRAGSTFGLVLIGLGIVRGLTGEFLDEWKAKRESAPHGAVAWPDSLDRFYTKGPFAGGANLFGYSFQEPAKLVEHVRRVIQAGIHEEAQLNHGRNRQVGGPVDVVLIDAKGARCVPSCPPP